MIFHEIVVDKKIFKFIYIRYDLITSTIGELIDERISSRIKII